MYIYSIAARSRVERRVIYVNHVSSSPVPRPGDDRNPEQRGQTNISGTDGQTEKSTVRKESSEKEQARRVYVCESRAEEQQFSSAQPSPRYGRRAQRCYRPSRTPLRRGPPASALLVAKDYRLLRAEIPLVVCQHLDVLVERIHERLDVLQDRLGRAYGRECEQFLVVPHR